ncbi:MAG: hypothetical protein ACOC22_01425 [bacterium]
MKAYIVYYEGEMKMGNGKTTQVKGYYAAKQPHYEWSFTDNIENALLYKTKKGALERKNFNYGIFAKIAKIFEVDVITTFKIGDEVLR